jgi:hypothetical protein
MHLYLRRYDLHCRFQAQRAKHVILRAKPTKVHDVMMDGWMEPFLCCCLDGCSRHALSVMMGDARHFFWIRRFASLFYDSITTYDWGILCDRSAAGFSATMYTNYECQYYLLESCLLVLLERAGGIWMDLRWHGGAEVN